MTNNTNASVELLPCPFCGCRPDDCPQNSYRPHPQRKGDWCVYIWCDNCDACGPERREALDAITAWNTRTSHKPDASVEERADILSRVARAIETAEKTQGNPHYLHLARAAIEALGQTPCEGCEQPDTCRVDGCLAAHVASLGQTLPREDDVVSRGQHFFYGLDHEFGRNAEGVFDEKIERADILGFAAASLMPLPAAPEQGLGGPDGQPAGYEPGLASRPGPTGDHQAQGWQHELEDGSIDHEWVTEGGVTFCAQCEAPKPDAD